MCNLFAQLGARGVSVLFASGDRRRRQELRDQEPFRPVQAQISRNLTFVRVQYYRVGQSKSTNVVNHFL